MNYKNLDDYADFEILYKYDGTLGATYSKNKTKFVLWSPTASKVKVCLYGNNGRDYNCSPYKIIEMNKSECGTWIVDIEGDLDGEYYNYLVTIDNIENEVVDPYAKAVGVNGNRGMVVDLESTNPEGWSLQNRPILKKPTDAIIYEIHIRDFSIDENSGISIYYKGKYRGMCEKGTKLLNSNIRTGIDNLKELGINVVHLLPVFDYKSIDESKLEYPQYNWGYDPQNYNVPEGSYSSDPFNSKVRIREFKDMIMNFHNSGINVVMDVVYNHTADTENSNFNYIVPGYYYRKNNDGNFSNASQCGNEIASERYMVRKFIVDSLCYWIKEYKIDGFRFDLMGIHDIETMKIIRRKLDEIDKSILIYGEGWKAGSSPLKDDILALKNNILKFDNLQIAAFSDDIRDGIKGNVFNIEHKGFVNGNNGFEESIKFGIVASTEHYDVNYNKVIYSNKAWANEPYQTITYTSSHDNYTLWDKLKISTPNETKENKIKMNKLAAAIILTSQGIPFIQGGDELLRTKKRIDRTLEENSYNCPDSVNKIDWIRKKTYINVFNYYKGLIELRKNHVAFRMNSKKEILKNISFFKKDENFNCNNMVGYWINGKEVKDTWNKIVVIFNANDKDITISLPDKNWDIVVNGEVSGVNSIERIEGNKIKVSPISAYVLVKKK